MKLLRFAPVLFISVSALAFSADKEELPEMPFKKSLTLTSVLIFKSAYPDEEKITKLANTIAQYASLESKAEEVVHPLIETRKALKQAAMAATFKNSEDFNQVYELLKKNTDDLAAHNLQELQRDKLIRFDEKAESVLGSNQYAAILAAAKKYQTAQIALQKHPLFMQLEQTRIELKPLMHDFLKKNFSNIDELQKAFNNSIQSVNVYLDCLKNSQSE
jgi:hypothetical protein